MPATGDLTLYVATASGFVYALAPNGYVRWRADLGHLVHPCPQVTDGWGVTGTPVIDPDTRALYVADAFGRLHALDLATGRERTGWPVVLYRDFRRELDWGALTIVRGSVYVPTGSFCDQPPMEGKLLRIELATRRVTSWISVPLSLGGGGSVWGWGGSAYSARLDSIFVGTGNTFEGGTNVGKAFSEQAGNGEHLVQLSRDLDMRAANAPDLGSFPDNGFVGSPIVADRPGCDELVAAQTKSGTLFGWRAAELASGPVWRLQLQKSDPATPLLTQPTYSPRDDAFFVATSTQLVRISIDASCAPRVDWRTTLGDPTLYGSPTVAAGMVWLVTPASEFSGKPGALLGIDAGTGAVRVRDTFSAISFAPPTVLDGMLFVGAMHGVSATRFPAEHGRAASSLSEYTSRIDGRHAWQSREDGVYSTDDGGRHWRRIYSGYAVRVVRTSLRAGAISIGLPAPACNCTTRRLWTTDGGRTWHLLNAAGSDFEGRGASFYWWRDGSLLRVTPWPPSLRQRLASRQVASVPGGTIIDVANVPGGVAALVDRGAKPPQVILAQGSEQTVVTLPDAGDGAIPRSISVEGSTLVVAGKDLSSPAAAPDPEIEWRSRDGGRTWAVTP